METTDINTMDVTETTTSHNAQTDQLTVKLASHYIWNSVKDVTNVFTANMMTVSPQRNGTQPPLLNVQTNAPTVDQNSVETLLIQATPDNTLPAGKVLLSDVLLAQETWNTTSTGTPVYTKENSRPNQSIN